MQKPKITPAWLKANTTKDQRRTIKELPKMDVNMRYGGPILLHELRLDGSMVVCYPRHNGRQRNVLIGMDGHVQVIA